MESTSEAKEVDFREIAASMSDELEAIVRQTCRNAGLSRWVHVEVTALNRLDKKLGRDPSLGFNPNHDVPARRYFKFVFRRICMEIVRCKWAKKETNFGDQLGESLADVSPSHINVLEAEEMLRKFYDGASSHLTPRERQVLRSFIAGRSIKETAEELGISAASVQKHLYCARKKLAIISKTWD